MNFTKEHFDTDIGTEELGHFEMVCAIVHQLTRNLTMEQIEQSGFAPYFVDHTVGIYPIAASGVPFDALAFASKGDAITDLVDNLLRLCDDPDVIEPIKFLRAREIVHFQRFGEAKREVSSKYPGSEKPTTTLLPTTNYKKKMYEVEPDVGVLLKYP